MLSAPASSGRCLPTLALIACVLCGVSALGARAGTAAADVLVGPVQTVAGTTELDGVACPDATECLAAGVGSGVQPQAPGSGVLVPVDEGTAGTPQDVGGTYALSGIACPVLGDCLVAGFFTPDDGQTSDPVLVPLSDGQPGSTRSAPAEYALACPSDGDCIGVAESSVVAIADGGAGPPQAVSGAHSLDRVACSSTSTCFAVGFEARSGGGFDGMVVPITGGTPGNVVPVPGVFFDGIACASATTCYAVGVDNSRDGVVVPITSGAVGAVEDVPDVASLSDIACSSATLCIALGASGPSDPTPEAVVVPITNGAIGTGLGTGALSAADRIACASDTECIAVGRTNTAPVTGAIMPILASGSVGAPSALIGAPANGQAYALNDPTAPIVAFSCEPAFAGTLASSKGCTATVDGRAVTSGQVLDTSHAGTFTLSVTATQADGQQGVATTPFTVAKGHDSIFFPQIGPFTYAHDAVTLAAAAASGLPVSYTVLSGPCTVTETTLTLGGSGSCVVRADQPGNTNYEPASATSTITVDPPTPPVCADLGVSVASGQQATITLGCGDAPSDAGDPLSFVVATLPKHGSLTAFNTASGAVTYTPTGDYAGPDDFTFEGEDAQGRSDLATISIAVATLPASVAPPVVSGTVAIGHALVCSPGTWSGTAPLSYAYSWRRGGVGVLGRTTAHYLVRASDLGKRVTCTVTAKNAVGRASSQSAAFTVRPSSAFTFGKLAIRGDGSVSVRLTAPGAGRFGAVVSFAGPSTRTPKPRATRYAVGAAKATKPGTLTLKIQPSRRARLELGGTPHLSLTIAVTFKPTDGRSRTRTARLRT